MRYLSVILLVLLVSCSPDGEQGYTNDYYNPNGLISEHFFQPMKDANDVANIYGMANGNDNISVIASGCMFEVSCLPQDIFLAPFPGGSVYAENGNISMLRDVIPYTHEEFCNPESSSQLTKYKLSFPEHSMTYRVQQGGSIHTVCMTFGKTDGVTEITIVGARHYWVYQFTMEIVGMTVDGVKQPLPAQRNIEYKFYYNRYENSI